MTKPILCHLGLHDFSFSYSAQLTRDSHDYCCRCKTRYYRDEPTVVSLYGWLFGLSILILAAFTLFR
jgi:hypothetical protein